MRQTYLMTENQFAELLEACKPVSSILIGNVATISTTKANIFWTSLGKELNFNPMTVKTIPGKDKCFFTAEEIVPLPNKLKGSRCYLSGAMEKVPDFGVEWRQVLKPFLEDLGVTVLDPTDKPTDIIPETPLAWKEMRIKGEYDRLRKEIKLLRCVDLRMVDVSDFIIVNLDNDVQTCGTWEEIFLANRQKKPIIIRIKQGKNQCPMWLFGTLPHEMFFNSWNEVERYLMKVNGGEVDHLRRWLLFDF